jgi:ribosomal-protein-alanine N-acetyltransferase
MLSIDQMNVFTWQQFPRLETRRLVLRQITSLDAEDIFRIYSDEEVMRYWGSPPHRSIYQTRVMIDEISSSFQAQEGIRWGITLKDDGRFIGSGGHWRLMKRHFRAEIGYELARDCWGKGIMAEALEAIIQFGFKQLELHSIEAQVDPENTRSAHLLEKLRFQREGYLRESYYSDGIFTDTVIYSRLCTD